ncbi:signal peptidase I [Haliovirga abyssi]|uniref:Signal peptidase I n=1 Tax=Haliovirga abyssi TaxID=2996794 RepID=A0AAU9D844_9FUSO|nr:signal peptidase I [Haliovirga abyssi]BDU49746.1 signal peptidase I [Haliovirga abyssi]
MKNIYINILIYIVVTSFFAYIWIKEKELGKKIQNIKDKFSDKIIGKYEVKSPMKKKVIRGTVNWTETIVTAVVLVLVIQHFYVGNFLVPTGSMIPTIEIGDRVFGDMVSYNFRDPKRGEIVVFREPMDNKLLFTKRLIGESGDKVKIGSDKRIYINGKKLTDKKYDRDYFQLGYLGAGEWYIPKKGDTIQIAGEFKPAEGKLSDIGKLNDVQRYLMSRGDVITRALPYAKFIVNGKYETGIIMDFLRDDEIAKKLLSGEKITLKENYYFVLGDNSKTSFDSRWWGLVAEHRFRGRAMFRFWPVNRMGLLK